MNAGDEKGVAGQDRVDAPRPAANEVRTEGEGQGGARRSPLLRLARLDGRDTLKYEDTADK
ncbi:MAG: hypothetical protein ACT4PE_11280 [Candidatus Eiseniibacteriota bacterium]